MKKLVLSKQLWEAIPKFRNNMKQLTSIKPAITNLQSRQSWHLERTRSELITRRYSETNEITKLGTISNKLMINIRNDEIDSKI